MQQLKAQNTFRQLLVNRICLFDSGFFQCPPLRVVVRITPHRKGLNPCLPPVCLISADRGETVPISWNFAMKKKVMSQKFVRYIQWVFGKVFNIHIVIVIHF